MAKNVEAPFVFGVRVEGDAFTYGGGVETSRSHSQSKGYRIVVCVDEFQQIGDFPDSLTFQKKLRGIWQLQSHVSYCLYGSIALVPLPISPD